MKEKTIDNVWEITPSIWNVITEITNQHGYMSGIDRQSDRVKATGEIFTPTELVIKMLQKLPLEEIRPGKTVLDPACGDGQFLLPAILIKLALKQLSNPEILDSDEARIQAKLEALSEVFGVDIMSDNIIGTPTADGARKRILRVLGMLDNEEAKKIVKNNILIGNTLDPYADIIGQTANDKKQMIALFSESMQNILDQDHEQINPVKKNNVFLHRTSQPPQEIYYEFLRFLKSTGQKVPKHPKRSGDNIEIIEYTGKPFEVDRDF